MALKVKQQVLGQMAAAPGGFNSGSVGTPGAFTDSTPRDTPTPAAPRNVPASQPSGQTKVAATGENISALTPQTFTSYNPASGQPDPRDSTYWSNLAQLLATSQQEYGMLGLEQSSADTAYGQKLTEAGEDRRRNVRNLAESMIGSGLLRSGHHNRVQTEATTDYTNMLAGWQQGKSAEDAKRAAQMQAILQNLGIDEFGLYSGSVDRYTQHQLDAAANQSPTVEQPTPTSGPSEADIAKAFQVLANPKASNKAKNWARLILGA